MPERHFYRPGEHRPAFAHDPFNAIVGPRPIGWISSLSPGGVANLAPYSFFNAFCYTPPIIGFASNGWKHSVANIEATGEFGWNLAAEPLGEAMNWTSTFVEADIDEFALAGLAKAGGRHIAAPLVAAAPVSFECKLAQIVRLRSAAGEATDTWMVFGEVVGVHVDLAMVRDGFSIRPWPVRCCGPAGRPTISASARRTAFRWRVPPSKPPWRISPNARRARRRVNACAPIGPGNGHKGGRKGQASVAVPR